MKLNELAILSKLHRKSKIDEPLEFDMQNTGRVMNTCWGIRPMSGIQIAWDYFNVKHETMVARALLIVHAINALPDLLSLAAVAMTDHPELAECDQAGLKWNDLLAKQNQSPISIEEELARR